MRSELIQRKPDEVSSKQSRLDEGILGAILNLYLFYRPIEPRLSMSRLASTCC